MRIIWFRAWVLLGALLLVIPSDRTAQYDQGSVGLLLFVLQMAVLLPIDCAVSIVHWFVPPSSLSGGVGFCIAYAVAWRFDRFLQVRKTRRPIRHDLHQ